ncbi:MAG: MBL fold metallo-hydrolase [Candidatus Liptonbacteria bacterium]|nr:MBL fold metallo-hydrolase [Candidatus Liptonbacteria bacterium]
MSTRDKNIHVLILAACIALDVFLWSQVFLGGSRDRPELYFLDVGQGDSELIVLPGNVKILIDAGPDGKVLRSLERILGSADRYIDVAVITHPQLDHFNGFNTLLGRYRFGVFATNGRSVEQPEWFMLTEKLQAGRTPHVVLGAGDSLSYRDHSVSVLSPDGEWIGSGELNDTSLVMMVNSPRFRGLFTGDIGSNVEEYLADRNNLQADILKIPHHGSKYSSSDRFLKEVGPKITVIEVGQNRYGHPTEEARGRISAFTPHLFRTDRDGTVKLVRRGEKIQVFTER